MDLKSLKRRDLQALCKEHGIPANSSNVQMIDSLSSILQEKVKPKGCLKDSGDSAEDLGIVRGGSKQVTFVFRAEKKDEPVGKLKRKSMRRMPSTEIGGHYESPKNVHEVPRRATRSRGLAKSVLPSPAFGKKRSGTEGVRRNAEPSMGKEEKASIAEVPLTRSLRNRVVVVGGDVGLVTAKYTRNTQKRKNGDKKEQKENVAASVVEDEAVVKENPRKRPREEVTFEDEPPPRRPTRSHAKMDETVATEEVDIGRPKKRRKGSMEVLPVEKVVGKEIERGLKPGGSTKRSSGNKSDSGAMESGDVTGPTRRSPCSTSALLEAGTTVSAVGKLDQGAKAVRKNKSENQAKGGDSGSLLMDNVVVAVPVRRSTRSSSTLKEDAPLPVGGKSIRGKSQKQVTSLPASVAVSEPVGRSTHSSSALHVESTSAISAGESGDGVEVVGKTRSQKQMKEHGLKRGVPKISSPIAEAVAEPVRRSTRHTSNLDVVSLPDVRKSTKGGETVKHGKSQKRAKDDGGGSTEPLADNDVIVEHVKRSIHSSSLEDQASPVVGKSVKDGKASMKGRSRKQRKEHALGGQLSLASLSDSEAIGEPAKRLTRGSPKMSEDEPNSLAVGKLGGGDKAIRNNKPVKHKRDRSIERGGSAASLPDSRAVTTHTMRSTRGHSDAVRKDNSSKKRKRHIMKQGVSTYSLLDNEVATMPERRSTCRSIEVGEVLRSPHSRHKDKETVTKLVNSSTSQSSKVRAGSEVLKSPFSTQADNEASVTSSRRSTHRSLKLPSDSEILKSPCSMRLDDEAVATPARRSPLHSSKIPAEIEVLKSPRSSHPDHDASITPAMKVLAGSDVLMSPYSSHPDKQTAITHVTKLTSHLSKGPAESEVQRSPCSLLEDVKEDAHVKDKSLCEEQTCVQEAQIDTNRTFIERTVIAGQISFPGTLDTSLSEVSHDVDPETASQLRQSPENVLLEKTENDTSLLGTLKDMYDMSMSSHITEGHSSFIEVENSGRGESRLNIVEGFSEVQEEFSGKIACSNVDATVDAGTLESYRDDRDATAAPVDAMSSPVDNKKSSVCALDMDRLASMESWNIISHPVPPLISEEQSAAFHTEISTMASLKVPDSMREVDTDREDIPTIDATVPRSPFKSSDELTLTSNAAASLVFASKEPTSDLDSCSASEVGLEGNEAKYIIRQALVRKSSDELLHASVSPEIDTEEPELKVEVECPREDFWGGRGVDKILVTSNTEDCLETCSRISNEESDSKVEVHIGNKGHMEGTEASNTAGSPLSCKSAGVLSPTFLPTLHNEISPEIDVREPDLSMHAQAVSTAASDIGVYLVETSGTHSKTLEVSMTAERDACPNIQRSFDDEAENCMVDRDTILTDQLAPEESEAAEKIDASVTGSESQSCVGVEIIKETSASSTLSVMVNDGAETEGDKSGAEKNGEELMPSTPRDNPTCDLDSGGHMNEGGSSSSTGQSAPEESDAGKKIETSIAVSETRSCVGVEVLKEDCVSSNLSGMVNNDAAPEGNKSCDEKNGDEVMTSSLSKNPECDLDTGDQMKEGLSPSSKLAPEECDVGEKFEASIAGNELQSCIGAEVTRETWVSSTSAVTVNDDTETVGDMGGAEKNGDERSSASPSEHPLCDLDTGVHMKEHGSSSTAEDDVDDTSTLYYHDNSKKSDFTLSLHDKDLADAEGNLTDSSDDKFCEDINKHFRSLDASIISDGPSYVLPVASKDGESTPSLIATASSKAIEGKSSVDHGSSFQTMGASGKFGKQLEKEDVVRVDDVGSTEISALATENRSPTVAVLFGGDTKSGDLPVLSVDVTCDKEIWPITTSETPATLGYKSSVNKGNIQELPGVPGSEAARLMPAGMEVAFSGKGSIVVDSVDRSPKLTFKGHEALGQLNKVVNIAPETAHTANELADVEHESLELATVAEEMENVDSLESNASIKGEDDTVVMKTDSIGRSTSVHFDELCEKLDEASLLQSGELHPASARGDGKVSSPENFASATDMENVPSLPKMELVLSEEDHLTNCNTEKAFVEEDTLNMEDFSCSASSVPLADQNESPDTIECFEQASNAEEGVAHGAMPMPAEDLYCIDNKVANFVNYSTQVYELGHHEENIGHITGLIAVGDGEMNAVVSSGGSDANNKEDSPYNREISLVAENLSGCNAKPCAVMDAQDIHFADQYDDQEERRISIQESLEVSKFRKEEISTVLDVTRIEGSPTRVSQIEKFESTLMPTVAEQEDMTARKCSELSVTDDADQVVFWDCNESSAVEGRVIGNELEDPELRVNCTAQQAVVSLDTRAFGINSEATHESIVNQNDQTAHEECFEDFSVISTAKSQEIGEGAVKDITLSGSSDAVSEEASPDDCQTPPKADNLPSVSAKQCAGLGSQEIHFADQYDDTKETRTYIQESLEVSEFRNEEISTVLDVSRIEGSPTRMMPTVATARKCTEIYMTNDADQVVFLDCKESSSMEERSIRNELEDPESRVTCTAQQAVSSLDTGAFGINSEATHESIVNKNDIIAREESFADFSEISTAKSQEIEEGAMKDITISGSSDATNEDASPDDCQTPSKAVDQSKDKEEWRSLPETSEISEYMKEETVVKIEGSLTVTFKSEKIEVALMPTVAEQGELNARDHTELSVTNVADQVVSWDYGESSVMDRRHIENELGDPEFRGACTSEHTLSSLDAGDVGVSCAGTQDSTVNKDDTMAPEDYFEDFRWSFPDTNEVDSSQQEAQVVDSQLATESTLDKAYHSSESGNDIREEQNRRSDLEQNEDDDECVQRTPMQLTRNFGSYSVIDDAMRNKENSVGLKMGSTQKQNEKSSRRPLQSVPRTKSEH